MVAGLRVQHEDKVMLVPFFLPVENKTGLIVSQEVSQLIDYIATWKDTVLLGLVLALLGVGTVSDLSR